LASVDSGSEFGMIAEDAEGTEDLGELVISEGGEEIEIVEAAESSAPEGSGQIGTEELGSLVEGNALSIVRGDVIEGRESVDDEADEFDAAAAGSSDERGEGAATVFDESAGDLADVPNAPFQERNRPLASEERGDLGVGEPGQKVGIPEREAAVESPPQAGGERPIAVVGPTVVLDLPARFAPETEIEGIEEQNVIGCLLRSAAPMQRVIPGREIW
jgi:hypothetical protein